MVRVPQGRTAFEEIGACPSVPCRAAPGTPPRRRGPSAPCPLATGRACRGPRPGRSRAPRRPTTRPCSKARPAHGHHHRVAGQHRLQRLDVTRAVGRGREELEIARARVIGLEGLGRGAEPRHRAQAAVEGDVDHLRPRVGRNDDAPARLGHRVDPVPRQHRARPADHVVAEGLDEALDGGDRLGRVQRDLDDADPGVLQGRDVVQHLVGLDPAQDGHDRDLGHGLFERHVQAPSSARRCRADRPESAASSPSWRVSVWPRRVSAVS